MSKKKNFYSTTDSSIIKTRSYMISRKNLTKIQDFLEHLLTICLTKKISFSITVDTEKELILWKKSVRPWLLKSTCWKKDNFTFEVWFSTFWEALSSKISVNRARIFCYCFANYSNILSARGRWFSMPRKSIVIGNFLALFDIYYIVVSKWWSILSIKS